MAKTGEFPRKWLVLCENASRASLNYFKRFSSARNRFALLAKKAYNDYGGWEKPTDKKIRSCKMPEPKFNPVTGKMEFPVAEKKEGSKKVRTTTMVAIPITSVKKLVEYARADGADLTSDTDKGEAAKQMHAARFYILAAIDGLIAQREKPAGKTS